MAGKKRGVGCLG